MTAQVMRLPARRCFRQVARLGLDRDMRLAIIDTKLREIEEAIATLRGTPCGCDATCGMRDDYKQYRDLARTIAASVLDRPIAEVTDDTPLDSDDLALVVVELSLAGIEVKRDRIKTVGDLIKRLRPPSGP